MKQKLINIIAAALLTTSPVYAINLMDITESVTKGIGSSGTQTNASSSEISSGLKEALVIGVKSAVNILGQENGFLNNSLVKIPLPKGLEQTAKLAKAVGGEKYANDLIIAMNKAASEAVPKTADIFVNAIQNMSIEDGKKVLNGGDKAATEFLQNKTSTQLKDAILPIVKKRMDENQVASYLKSFNKYYQSPGVKDIAQNSAVGGLAKSFGMDKYLPGSKDSDIESYVTNKTISGVFTMIAEKEKAIRSTPALQSTKLLQKIFGGN